MTGANFFDLSPRNIDGRYPGKAVAMLCHMVFKVGLGLNTRSGLRHLASLAVHGNTLPGTCK